MSAKDVFQFAKGDRAAYFAEHPDREALVQKLIEQHLESAVYSGKNTWLYARECISHVQLMDEEIAGVVGGEIYRFPESSSSCGGGVGSAAFFFDRAFKRQRASVVMPQNALEHSNVNQNEVPNQSRMPVFYLTPLYALFPPSMLMIIADVVPLPASRDFDTTQPFSSKLLFKAFLFAFCSVVSFSSCAIFWADLRIDTAFRKVEFWRWWILRTMIPIFVLTTVAPFAVEALHPDDKKYNALVIQIFSLVGVLFVAPLLEMCRRYFGYANWMSFWHMFSFGSYKVLIGFALRVFATAGMYFFVPVWVVIDFMFFRTSTISPKDPEDGKYYVTVNRESNSLSLSLLRTFCVFAFRKAIMFFAQQPMNVSRNFDQLTKIPVAGSVISGCVLVSSFCTCGSWVDFGLLVTADWLAFGLRMFIVVGAAVFVPNGDGDGDGGGEENQNVNSNAVVKKKSSTASIVVCSVQNARRNLRRASSSSGQGENPEKSTRLRKLHEFVTSMYLYGTPICYGGINHYQVLWWYVLAEGVTTTALFPMFLWVYIYVTQVSKGVSEDNSETQSSVLEQVFFHKGHQSLLFIAIAFLSDFLQDKIVYHASAGGRCDCGTRFSKFFGGWTADHWGFVGACNSGGFVFFFMVTFLRALRVAGIGGFGVDSDSD